MVWVFCCCLWALSFINMTNNIFHTSEFSHFEFKFTHIHSIFYINIDGFLISFYSFGWIVVDVVVIFAFCASSSLGVCACVCVFVCWPLWSFLAFCQTEEVDAVLARLCSVVCTIYKCICEQNEFCILNALTHSLFLSSKYSCFIYLFWNASYFLCWFVSSIRFTRISIDRHKCVAFSFILFQWLVVYLVFALAFSSSIIYNPENSHIHSVNATNTHIQALHTSKPT